MGNTNDTTTPPTAEDPKKTSVKPVSEKVRVPVSVEANDQPAVHTPANFTTSLPTNNNFVTTDQQPSSTRETGRSTPVLLRKSPPIVEQLPSASVQKPSPSASNNKPSSSVIIKQELSPTSTNAYKPPSNRSNIVSLPHLAAAITFEKAPMIRSNYIVKTGDNESINIYTLDTMTVMQRTPSQPSIPGNRWYDHDPNKNLKPLVTKYL